MSIPADIMDAIAYQVGLIAGIGVAVSNKARTSNIATLTIPSGHGMVAGNIVLVRNVGTDFDGYQTITSSTSISISYSNSGADTSSTCSGMASTRVAQGKRRFSETENLEEVIRAMTAETQGYFAFKPATRDTGTQTDTGTFSISGVLYYNLPKDVTTTTDDLVDLAEAVMTALGVESHYASAGGKPIRGSYFEGEDLFEDGIAEFEFTQVFQVGPVCGA